MRVPSRGSEDVSLDQARAARVAFARNTTVVTSVGACRTGDSSDEEWEASHQRRFALGGSGRLLLKNAVLFTALKMQVGKMTWCLEKRIGQEEEDIECGREADFLGAK